MGKCHGRGGLLWGRSMVNLVQLAESFYNLAMADAVLNRLITVCSDEGVDFEQVRDFIQSKSDVFADLSEILTNDKNSTSLLDFVENAIGDGSNYPQTTYLFPILSLLAIQAPRARHVAMKYFELSKFIIMNSDPSDAHIRKIYLFLSKELRDILGALTILCTGIFHQPQVGISIMQRGIELTSEPSFALVEMDFKTIEDNENNNTEALGHMTTKKSSSRTKEKASKKGMIGFGPSSSQQGPPSLSSKTVSIQDREAETFDIISVNSEMLSKNGKGSSGNAGNAGAVTKHTLTPAHVYFLQLCMDSSMFGYASTYMSHPDHIIVEINPKANSLKVEDYLLYHYYAGIIYTALKKYGLAMACFENAITIPSEIVSSISFEAAKKAHLVNLLWKNSTYHLPSYTSSAVSRKCKDTLSTYFNITNLMKSDNVQGLQDLVDERQQELSEDGNLGLVRGIQASIVKKKLKELTSSYITLALTDLTAKAGLSDTAEAEILLLQLIRRGEIDASIDQSTGMVRFDSPESSNHGLSTLVESKNDIEYMASKMHEAMKLSHRLRALKQQVVTSKEYLKSKGVGRGGQSAMMGFKYGDETNIDSDI